MSPVRFVRACLAAALLTTVQAGLPAQADPTVTAYYGYGNWVQNGGTYCRAVGKLWVTNPGSTVHFTGWSTCDIAVSHQYISVGYSINSGIKTSSSNMCRWVTTCQGATFYTTWTATTRTYCTLVLVTYNLTETRQSQVKLCKTM